MTFAITVGLVAVAGLALVLLLTFLAKRRKEAHEIGPQRDSRGLRKLEPFFRRKVVQQKIKSLFPNTEPNKVLELLDANLPTTFGLERLQLALLKLSDGNLDELRRLVEMVTSTAGREKAVYVQLIGTAEWPEAERMGREYVNLLPEEQEPIFQRDLRQYIRWVKH